MITVSWPTLIRFGSVRVAPPRSGRAVRAGPRRRRGTPARNPKQPAGTQPVVTQPVVTQPVVSQPAV